MFDCLQVLIRACNSYPGYRVVVTGHSLGAGAAVVLAARLRLDQHYANTTATNINTCTSTDTKTLNTSTGANTSDNTSTTSGNIGTLASSGNNDVNVSLAADAPDDGNVTADVITSSVDVDDDDQQSSKTSPHKKKGLSSQKSLQSTEVSSAQQQTIPADRSDSLANTGDLMKDTKPGDIICFAFSPPGGLCSPEFARATLPYVMSVVVGDDLVPRLSMQSLHNLRASILTVLGQCGQPKYRLLAQVLPLVLVWGGAWANNY